MDGKIKMDSENIEKNFSFAWAKFEFAGNA